jgi:hypothetical protein
MGRVAGQYHGSRPAAVSRQCVGGSGQGHVADGQAGPPGRRSRNGRSVHRRGVMMTPDAVGCACWEGPPTGWPSHAARRLGCGRAHWPGRPRCWLASCDWDADLFADAVDLFIGDGHRCRSCSFGFWNAPGALQQQPSGRVLRLGSSLGGGVVPLSEGCIRGLHPGQGQAGVAWLRKWGPVVAACCECCGLKCGGAWAHCCSGCVVAVAALAVCWIWCMR